MSRSSEIDKLAEDHGRDGVRLLVLFRLLKSEVIRLLQQQNLRSESSEIDINQICVAKAYQLLRLGKDEPSEKDIKDVLAKIRAH